VAEVIAVGDDDGGGTPGAAESAHVAAVAEGATIVQAQQAAESAEEAKAAAEVALAAAEASIETAVETEGATQTATVAAEQATVSAEMVHQALLAQTAAIEALTQEMKASREQARKQGPAEPKPAAEPDTEPAKGHWYYGG
jgi:hypothetical protein